MPPVATIPLKLRPYAFHGVMLDKVSGDQQYGDCPFCGREDKFYVGIMTGQFLCQYCKEGGNSYSFIQKLWESSDKSTNVEEAKEFARDRDLLDVNTLSLWGVRQSLITNEWIIPGYNAKGKINQLYRRVNMKNKGVWVWQILPTPSLDANSVDNDTISLGGASSKSDKGRHGLHGVPLFDSKKSVIYLAEGVYDGMIFREAMSSLKRDPKTNTLIPTGNESISLLKDANVLAVPGCNVFNISWLPLFENKIVYLMYDSDYPQTIKNKTIPPVGYEGMKRVTQILANSDTPPKEVHYLKWYGGFGEVDLGYDDTRPSGYDVRDFLAGR